MMQCKTRQLSKKHAFYFLRVWLKLIIHITGFSNRIQTQKRANYKNAVFVRLRVCLVTTHSTHSYFTWPRTTHSYFTWPRTV